MLGEVELEGHTITLTLEGDISMDKDLHGFKGAIRRLRMAKENLDFT